MYCEIKMDSAQTRKMTDMSLREPNEKSGTKGVSTKVRHLPGISGNTLDI
jgi:hypothetical protein